MVKTYIGLDWNVQGWPLIQGQLICFSFYRDCEQLIKPTFQEDLVDVESTFVKISVNQLLFCSALWPSQEVICDKTKDHKPRLCLF